MVDRVGFAVLEALATGTATAQELTTTDDVPRLLSKVMNWQAPGGHFVLDCPHLPNFVDSFEPNLIAHHVDGDVLITRFTRHTVQPHDGNWRHEESLLVRDGNRINMYFNAFDQYVYTVRQLHRLLEEAGMRVVSTFGGFDRELPPRGRGHCVIVAQRQE